MAVRLITGGAGFIGRHLTASFLDAGDEVVVVDDGSSGRLEEVSERVTLRQADISDLTVKDWCELLEGVDSVFHLAAMKLHSPSANAESLIRTNIAATQSLVEACALMGVRKFVFASSLYAYGSVGPASMSEKDIPRPSTVYGVTKLAGEGLLRAAENTYGLSWAAARLFFVYGSGQYADGGYPSVITKTFSRILSGTRPIIHGSGEQVLDYIHVRDAVKALQLLASTEFPNAVVNVCTGVGVSVSELIREISRVASSDLCPENGPPDWTEGTVRLGATSSLLEQFGWQPSVQLSEGLLECWQSEFQRPFDKSGIL